jgi:hypothetical protein
VKIKFLDPDFKKIKEPIFPVAEKVSGVIVFGIVCAAKFCLLVFAYVTVKIINKNDSKHKDAFFTFFSIATYFCCFRLSITCKTIRNRMEEFIKLQNVIGYIGNGQYCISVKDLCVWYVQFQAVSFIRF